MINKKYLLLAGLCSVLTVQTALAQESQKNTASWSSRDMTYRGQSYDVLDSSYYSGKRLKQYRSYMNHQTVYPPKPNNMWEIGLNLGMSNIIGDVTSKSVFTAKKPTNAMGWGITVRKALGYFFSLRAEFIHAVANGLEYRVHSVNEAPWTTYYSNLYPNGFNYIYQNYRTTISEFSLQMIGNLGNVSFHHGKNSVNLYAIAGPALMNYDPKVDALDANGKPYDFRSIQGYPGGTGTANWSDRKTIDKQLNNLLDGTYESSPGQESHKGNSGHNIIPVASFGLGLQFKLGNRVSLNVEDKLSYTFRDKLDASQLQMNGSLTPDKDIWNYANIGLNFNIGNKKKNVAPLWWVNPLDHGYSELSDPRHMNLPEPVLPDADGDGIPDQFDKCPGTPAGVSVDSHGCPLDTDGDGVPDYKDKQLITPTECQPVDADGVGKCPCPDGCGAKVAVCGTIGAGSLNFSGNSARINPSMQAQLSNLAAQMAANPTCKVVIIGSGNGSKVQQQRSWDRVNSVIEYMSEKHGLDRNRFIFQYGQAGDENSVMYRSANAGEEGPVNVAPPFPNLRRN